MVQRTIAVNQFTATYLIEFSAEPRWCNRTLVDIVRLSWSQHEWSLWVLRDSGVVIGTIHSC